MSSVPTITLNNGIEIPQLGFGVWQVRPQDTKAATLTAFETGYRHIDTAQMYKNEQGVGEAVRESGLDRGDVFITSKLNNGFHAHDDALKAFDTSLETLGFDYLDLFLIHWPLPGIDIDFVETWGALEEIYSSGRAKAIGVSNFQPNHLRRVVQEGTVVPAVNQIEVHPFLTQEEARAANADNGIATEAWSPLAQGLVVDNPVIAGIAKTYDKSPAQVALRWTLQRGDIVFPKSVTAERIKENFEVFDFELTDADMGVITALDSGQRTGPNPDEFNWIP
ncbi:aldo/keto reductase [Aeromicrobium panaciterrae]|uniref:aldo/keto reductase n=1 Tax=Aeromicrobium panaciterrae TaxID=363861 RepID=UPI0031D1814A